MNFWSSQFRANLRNTKLEILQTNEEDKLQAEHDTNNWKIIFYYLLYMRAANIIVVAKEIWLNFEATILVDRTNVKGNKQESILKYVPNRKCEMIEN